jgi:Domain of unknown function (DUF1707)/Domain of unknown function (DUF4190)
MVMDAGRILVSDAEREAVVARLHAATVEGRLTLDEFGERTSRAYASRTRADLAAVLDGLPWPHLLPPPMGAPPPLVVAPPTTNLPLVSMIVGIVSVSAGVFAFLSGPMGVAAIVLGILGLRAVRRGTSGSRGMAIAGIATGCLGVLAEVGLVVLFVGGFGN